MCERERERLTRLDLHLYSNLLWTKLVQDSSEYKDGLKDL